MGTQRLVTITLLCRSTRKLPSLNVLLCSLISSALLTVNRSAKVLGTNLGPQKKIKLMNSVVYIVDSFTKILIATEHRCGIGLSVSLRLLRVAYTNTTTLHQNKSSVYYWKFLIFQIILIIEEFQLCRTHLTQLFHNIGLYFVSVLGFNWQCFFVLFFLRIYVLLKLYKLSTPFLCSHVFDFMGS